MNKKEEYNKLISYLEINPEELTEYLADYINKKAKNM